MRLVSRTVEVLNALAEAPDGVGVTRLAEQLGESPSTVHRLLVALMEHDYVSRDPDRRYHLGVGVQGLAFAFQRRDRMVALARPYLSAIVADTRESVFLAEQMGDDVICVASAESPRLLAFYMRLGQRTPYHAGASARAILAFKPQSEQLRLLHAEHLQAFTPRTPRSIAAAMAELEATRARGYAVCDEEMEVGVTAISVPVADATGNVTASLTLVAPQDRLAGPARLEAARLIARASRSISKELGHGRTGGREASVRESDRRDALEDIPRAELATAELRWEVPWS
jgi:IclR family acetate operon transcriptional repressor